MVLLFGVFLNYLIPAKVFVWVTSIATFGAIWTWAIVLVTQMKFRRSLNDDERGGLVLRVPWYPYASWSILAFLLLVIGLMAYSQETRIALLVGPMWLVTLTALYYLFGLNSSHNGRPKEV